MFRASLWPSSGEQRPCYCIWCVVLVLLDVVGSGCGALSCRMWALVLDVVGSGCGALSCRMWALVLDVVGSGCGALSCRMWALVLTSCNNKHLIVASCWSSLLRLFSVRCNLFEAKSGGRTKFDCVRYCVAVQCGSAGWGFNVLHGVRRQNIVI